MSGRSASAMLSEPYGVGCPTVTEAEWQASADPLMMLARKLIEADERKLRLFAVACCRSVEHLLIDPRSKNAVAVAEEYADGLATENELEAAGEQADAVWNAAALDSADGFDDATTDAAEAAAYAAFTETTYLAALHAADASASAVQYGGRRQDKESHQAALLRDIFGNPFRPAALDPTWRTSTVIALAAGIYADRAFDRLPILADALEDAGCSAAEVLAHCRTDGPHVRGCHVVDLVLGRAQPMSPDELRSAADPYDLYQAVGHRLTVRRRWLFAAACARRALPVLEDDDRFRRAVEAAERYADHDHYGAVVAAWAELRQPAEAPPASAVRRALRWAARLAAGSPLRDDGRRQERAADRRTAATAVEALTLDSPTEVVWYAATAAAEAAAERVFSGHPDRGLIRHFEEAVRLVRKPLGVPRRSAAARKAEADRLLGEVVRLEQGVADAAGRAYRRAQAEEEAAAVGLLKCVAGAVVGPVGFDVSWRTSAVTGLAAAIDEGWAFGRLPVLADALEEAGCGEPAVLDHCRSDGPHCRGCFVVDLALGRSSG